MPVTQSTRRFEYVGGGSDKFWKVTVNGNQVVIRYGRNGTNGQTNTKTFDDDSAATKHAEKLIKEKTGKGYTEVR